MVGGGPVYLDADQLFFQICLPARAVPAASRQALRVLLEPGGDRLSCGRRAGRAR